MGIDWYVGACKFIDASSMVEMQVADDDSFDILDVVSSLGNGSIKVMLSDMIHSRKDIVDGCADEFWIVLACLVVSSASLLTSALPAPVSHKIRPSSGCSMRAEIMTISRNLCSGCG